MPELIDDDADPRRRTLRELHKPLLQDCEINCVMLNSEIGRETYKRSLNYLFLKALT